MIFKINNYFKTVFCVCITLAIQLQTQAFDIFCCLEEKPEKLVLECIEKEIYKFLTNQTCEELTEKILSSLLNKNDLRLFIVNDGSNQVPMLTSPHHFSKIVKRAKQVKKLRCSIFSKKELTTLDSKPEKLDLYELSSTICLISLKGIWLALNDILLNSRSNNFNKMINITEALNQMPLDQSILDKEPFPEKHTQPVVDLLHKYMISNSPPNGIPVVRCLDSLFFLYDLALVMYPHSEKQCAWIFPQRMLSSLKNVYALGRVIQSKYILRPSIQKKLQFFLKKI